MIISISIVFVIIKEWAGGVVVQWCVFTISASHVGCGALIPISAHPRELLCLHFITRTAAFLHSAGYFVVKRLGSRYMEKKVLYCYS